MQSFFETLYRRAHDSPDAVAFRFFEGGQDICTELTFGQVYSRVLFLAARLEHLQLQGERILLTCKSQHFFVLGFLACLLAGSVAVPAPPPTRKGHAARLMMLMDAAGVRAVIGDIDHCNFNRNIIYIDIQDVVFFDHVECDGFASLGGDKEAIALLQFTSGSTSDPKGVMVTVGGLIHNCEAIAGSMGITPESSVLTALPLFHDMGLIGGVLVPVFIGCVGNFMQPMEFVQFPERWLQYISDYGITISGGPNFIYELAVRGISNEKFVRCDLSRWRVAFCGAEPIRPGTIDRFSARFASVGFRPEAFYPCYGMAESTLFVTGKPLGALPEVCNLQGRVLVNCGVARGDTQIRIVDPQTQLCLPDQQVGEIWVSSPSVAAGYWQLPDLSAEVFHARLRGDPHKYLRTGDLGFLKDQALYLVGRLKDQLVVYGKKYAPNDLEAEAQASHEALRADGGAAFVLNEEDGDKVLLVFELKRAWLRRPDEWPKVDRAVRHVISNVFGLALEELVLIRPGSLPRTSSGKVRRHQCRHDYKIGALERVI